jgi:transposase-like protein
MRQFGCVVVKLSGSVVCSRRSLQRVAGALFRLDGAFHSASSVQRASSGQDRRQLPREERREVVAAVLVEGHSVRAIAGALGVGKSTIYDDVSGSGHVTEITTGMDGKSYPAAGASELREVLELRVIDQVRLEQDACSDGERFDVNVVYLDDSGAAVEHGLFDACGEFGSGEAEFADQRAERFLGELDVDFEPGFGRLEGDLDHRLADDRCYADRDRHAGDDTPELRGRGQVLSGSPARHGASLSGEVTR